MREIKNIFLQEYLYADVNQFVLVKSSMTSVAPAVFYRIYGDCSHPIKLYLDVPTAYVVWVVVGHLTNND